MSQTDTIKEDPSPTDINLATCLCVCARLFADTCPTCPTYCSYIILRMSSALVTERRTTNGFKVSIYPVIISLYAVCQIGSDL